MRREDLPKVGKFKGEFINRFKIKGTWQHDKGSEGEFDIILYPANFPSVFPSTKISTWEEFIDEMSNNIQHKNNIFRGQRGRNYELQWKLRTSFHRMGRVDLLRYKDEVIPELCVAINKCENRSFDFNDPIQCGELLTLAQHHGFPTPLLDWTYSYEVAAYFAYADVPKDMTDGYVRIFSFDKDAWENLIT